ncbi:hypothetical protein FISHEDRAFT_62872 [Fistulina hepatica ATCC 64428]|uniref:Fungal N-terminal domain-containing protein n=1 Tax=Fistulina hepatica ATCC 64428 TaxID=1128425 RepID=A0A0D7A0C1_9AGAR|nr:hypothetical protein FISHEDRAFT_62872 [Fistulina hepatica ATCC 64428]
MRFGAILAFLLFVHFSLSYVCETVDWNTPRAGVLQWRHDGCDNKLRARGWISDLRKPLKNKLHKDPPQQKGQNQQDQQDQQNQQQQNQQPVRKPNKLQKKPPASKPSTDDDNASVTSKASHSSKRTTVGDMLFDQVGPALALVQAAGALTPILYQTASVAVLLWEHVKKVKDNKGDLERLSIDAARLVKTLAEINRGHPLHQDIQPLKKLLEDIDAFVNRKLVEDPDTDDNKSTKSNKSGGSKKSDKGGETEAPKRKWRNKLKSVYWGGRIADKISSYRKKLAQECSLFSASRVAQLQCAIANNDQLMRIEVQQELILSNQDKILNNQHKILDQQQKILDGHMGGTTNSAGPNKLTRTKSI